MATIDFHCHLDLYDNPVFVAEEAARRGIYVLSVTTTPTAFEGTCALAPPNSRIRTALGLHPELAAKRAHELPLFEQLLPQTCYVGEIGLDGSAPHRASLDQQAGILTDILGITAKAGGRVMSLHSRGATTLLLDVLAVEPRAGTPVLHWFSGSPREVMRAAEQGCWFSVGSPMLGSAKGRAAISAMPRDRVLTETDGPFGTVNGRAAYPWDASQVAFSLADLWREDRSAISRQLRINLTALAAATANVRLEEDTSGPSKT